MDQAEIPADFARLALIGEGFVEGQTGLGELHDSPHLVRTGSRCSAGRGGTSPATKPGGSQTARAQQAGIIAAPPSAHQPAGLSRIDPGTLPLASLTPWTATGIASSPAARTH